MSARQVLEKMRREMLEKWREVAPLDAAEFERIDRAIASLESDTIVAPNEFSGLQIVEAAKVYLHRVRREVPMKELSLALIAGGINSKGERPAEWKIAQSIGYHVTKGNLTLVNDMVGLVEWKKR